MSSQGKDLRTRILNCLDDLADDPKAVVFDDELNRLLEVWRYSSPVAFQCSCGQVLSWWALDPQLAIVRTAKRRKPKTQSNGEGGIYEFVDTNPDTNAGFQLWDREAMATQSGRKQVELTDNPTGGVTGILTRRKFKCGRCGREYPLTNATMLREYVKAKTSRTRQPIVM